MYMSLSGNNKQLEYGDNIYKHYNTEISWSGAVETCENSGRRLLDIKTKREQRIIERFMQSTQ